jgi:hypothetical protein
LNAEITARLEATFKGESMGCGFKESRIRELIHEELAKTGLVPDAPENETGFSIPMQRRKA